MSKTEVPISLRPIFSSTRACAVASGAVVVSPWPMVPSSSPISIRLVWKASSTPCDQI